ncbi:hypothetical protein ABZ348_22120 [Streptomyces sp. NPDC005963]|uniref:hypothetical protein n=1 Tax=Streptomyces sp. NPDC005963 TaxID=3156721 RepID=UPI0033E682A1
MTAIAPAPHLFRAAGAVLAVDINFLQESKAPQGTGSRGGGVYKGGAANRMV